MEAMSSAEAGTEVEIIASSVLLYCYLACFHYSRGDEAGPPGESTVAGSHAALYRFRCMFFNLPISSIFCLLTFFLASLFNRY